MNILKNQTRVHTPSIMFDGEWAISSLKLIFLCWLFSYENICGIMYRLGENLLCVSIGAVDFKLKYA